MIVSRIASTTGPSSQARQTGAAANPASAEPVSHRALVPVEPPGRMPAVRPARPDASFVTHLIAMAEQTPQTRTLRRATPADAHAVYGRAAALRPNYYGKALSQTA
ncbi:hypothetical protein [Afipia sp. DC4300-2b1]|uniref:hypothetical protein n=1 Tax=Afipia sp. DC4300-2b1 TaxID=2804672 RepID=UPI003CFA6ED5